MKIGNVDREILHIFRTAWRILWNFQERCDLCDIKSHKNQGFTLSFTFLKKPQGGGQTDPLPPAVLEFKFKIFMTSS